ncbi:intron Large complex component GCFC2 [Nelusetta ayraudi]|uniref:intron Large complex component GCFC2 n=1 Tax=Nelusetta ayraudi TaxID=303726 RepID=UPI003F6F673A
MFNKKTRRNFRQRKENSSDEEEEQKDNNAAGEPEKGLPVVNKPLRLAQNRGITCSSKRESSPPKPQSSDEEDGETLEVTKEIEEKNKVNEKTNSILSFSDDKDAEEPTFKVKKSCEKSVLFQVRKKETLPAKTTNSKGHDITASPPAQHHHDVDSSSDDENDDESFQGDVMSPAPSSASDSSYSATDIVIPNAEAIQAARRKRSAIRAQKEFIPFSKDGQSSAGSTPDHYSKEDDEDKIDDDDDNEPDDHERRIEFAPRHKTIKERIAEKLGGSDDGSLSGSEGEEQKLWEETQIGKGFKRRPGDRSPSGSESSHSSRSSRSSRSSSSRNRQDRHMQKKRSAGVRVPKTIPSVSVSLVKKRITGKLDSLKEVFRARQAVMRRMEGDVESAKAMVESFEESSPEKKLKFYRDMTFYGHNLVECLREKVVEINSLELELHSLLSEHMEALLVQRRQRIKETADRLQQLSYSSDAQDTICTSETEAQRPDFDGPGDTELPAEEEELLQKKKDEILLRSQELFSDVQDEFCDVKKILSRFEEWRGFYSDSYHSAYISLCLPKLLNPIIRHQLLAWNPLRDTTGDLEGLPWFTAVETFCHGHGHEELEHTDRQMLSTIIEKSVLPKMTAYVQLVWDPESSHQSVCLSNICHKLKEDYSIFEGEHSKPVKAFLESVLGRLRSCVDEDVFIPLYPSKFLSDPSSPQCQFRNQQFWTAIKLFGNMGKWDLLLPESLLKELMLDKLLNRYLMITLGSETQHNGAVRASRKIADGLPLSWLSGQTSCLPQFNNFRNLLVQKIHTICKDQSPEDPNTRSSVVEVLQILSKIRCNDLIMAVAGKYHLEEVVYSQQLLNQEAV